MLEFQVVKQADKEKLQYCQQEVKFAGQVFRKKGMLIDVHIIKSLCPLKNMKNKIQPQ